MTNDEFPMTKQIRVSNDEASAGERAGSISIFVLRHSFGIRPSDFLVFQSLLTSAATIL